jgi:hypothetical protein
LFNIGREIDKFLLFNSCFDFILLSSFVGGEVLASVILLFDAAAAIVTVLAIEISELIFLISCILFGVAEHILFTRTRNGEYILFIICLNESFF